MTLSFNTLKSEIKRHLSIIGKRLYNKEGQNMFSDITVSSVEDPIFEQYISTAAENIEAMLRQLMTVFSVTSSSVTITLSNTRGSSDFDSRCGELAKSYIIRYAVGEYLAMTHPDLAQKYQLESAGAMQSLVTYAFYKNPPTTMADPLSPTTVVS